MVGEKDVYLLFRACTTKTTDFLALEEQNNGGKTTQPVAPRQAHIVIRIDLDQQYFAVQASSNLLQHRRQGAARRTPVSPEIHQYRAGPGGFQHFFGKIGFVYVKNGGMRHFFL